MKNLKRTLLAVAMVGIVSGGALAQKQGDDKRPAKPETRVVVQPKREKPPPNNNNQDKRNDERKGKP